MAGRAHKGPAWRTSCAAPPPPGTRGRRRAGRERGATNGRRARDDTSRGRAQPLGGEGARANLSHGGRGAAGSELPTPPRDPKLPSPMTFLSPPAGGAAEARPLPPFPVPPFGLESAGAAGAAAGTGAAGGWVSASLLMAAAVRCGRWW